VSGYAYKRNGKWVARAKVDGKQVWIPGGPWDTERDARKAARRHVEEMRARKTSETCASFADRWLKEWPRPAAGTRRHYRYAIKHFVAKFGDRPLGDIDRLEARTWALSVSRTVSKVAGIMYEDARNVDLVAVNPFANLRLPVADQKRDVHVPTMEEYRALIEACGVLGNTYGAEFRAMIQFSAWTGVRAGELHGLQWQDVGEETVTIRRSRKRDGTLGTPKNGWERTISFLPPARVLDDLPRRPDPFVFHSPRMKPLVQGSHHYAWREVRAAAGLPDLRWHSLRHFCATQLLEMGVDHFAVAVQLGHRDGGALVMSTYGHPSEQAARDRLSRLFTLEHQAPGSSAGSRKAAI
jgi:integrase